MFPAEQGGDPFLALTNSLARHPQLGWLYPADEGDKLRANPTAFVDLLSRALAGLPADAQWLLIVDQMEELFTPACEALREPFLDCLLAATELPRLRVIATVRSDFLAQCIEHPGLLKVQNNSGLYGVRAPGPSAMSRMIAGPVQDLDLADPLTLDPALVTCMVDDAVTESGGLALLAFALKDLYEQCRASGRMDLAASHSPEFGGLKGVIQRRADRALERSGKDGRDALPRVFSRLLMVQPDGTATRRREDLSHWGQDDAALTLIRELTRRDTRLLVAGRDDQPTVEVAHEALLREWPTLVAWIDDAREALRLRERVAEETRLWVHDGRPGVRLWKHELLAPARQLLAEAALLDDLGRQLRPDAGYPVDHVSWYDATAFCRWLSHQLGFELRLPEEWEWQWAAQSARPGYAYPWGEAWRDGVANTEQAGIGRTTAVGMYPEGRSLQGAHDLSGNVWEWCRGGHDKPGARVSNDESRVLRGGSWFDFQVNARAVNRNHFLTHFRDYFVGFRVLFASPIR